MLDTGFGVSERQDAGAGRARQLTSDHGSSADAESSEAAVNVASVGMEPIPTAETADGFHAAHAAHPSTASADPAGDLGTSVVETVSTPCWTSDSAAEASADGHDPLADGDPFAGDNVPLVAPSSPAPLPSLHQRRQHQQYEQQQQQQQLRSVSAAEPMRRRRTARFYEDVAEDVELNDLGAATNAGVESDESALPGSDTADGTSAAGMCVPSAQGSSCAAARSGLATCATARGPNGRTIALGGPAVGVRLCARDTTRRSVGKRKCCWRSSVLCRFLVATIRLCARARRTDCPYGAILTA